MVNFFFFFLNHVFQLLRTCRFPVPCRMTFSLLSSADKAHPRQAHAHLYCFGHETSWEPAWEMDSHVLGLLCLWLPFFTHLLQLCFCCPSPWPRLARPFQSGIAPLCSVTAQTFTFQKFCLLLCLISLIMVQEFCLFNFVFLISDLVPYTILVTEWMLVELNELI